jgi:hypothetical protein
MAYGPYRDLDSLGQAIAAELCAGADAPVEGKARDAAALIAAVIERNFATEAAIEREVEQQIAKLGAQAAGMDPHKLRAGLRERIAKHKGFVL